MHITVKTTKLPATNLTGTRIKATEINPQHARTHTCTVPWDHALSHDAMHAHAARQLAGPAANLVTVNLINDHARGYLYTLTMPNDTEN